MLRSVMSPCPSWPNLLNPQLQMSLSKSNASTWFSPQTIDTINLFLRSYTIFGIFASSLFSNTLPNAFVVSPHEKMFPAVLNRKVLNFVQEIC